MENAEDIDTKSVSDVLQSTQIALDGYEDIFSDFDPSHYSKRLLSIDFLRELYRRYTSTEKGDLIINFTMPSKLRSQETETLIRRRIRDFFKERLRKIDKKKKNLKNKGLVRIAVGIAASILVSVGAITMELPEEGYLITVPSVLAWYLLWSGFELFFDSSGKHRGKKNFYEKMIKARYNFMDEEKLLEQIEIAASPAHEKFRYKP